MAEREPEEYNNRFNDALCRIAAVVVLRLDAETAEAWKVLCTDSAAQSSKIERLEQSCREKDERTRQSNKKWEEIERNFYLLNQELERTVARAENVLRAVQSNCRSVFVSIELAEQYFAVQVTDSTPEGKS